jgi:uncharacterized short protein YbdD (DUF466 family)
MSWRELMMMLNKMWYRIRHLWHLFRRLSGDDAYERYLKHHAEFHASSIDAPAVLSRKEFFKYWQESKWEGIKRCC